jgi:acetyl esterase/lipase
MTVDRARRALLTGSGALAALCAAGCDRLEFLAANLPATLGPYTRRSNIAYGDDPRQRLDLYVPDRLHGGRAPVVVFWHGGRWSYGDKSQYRFVGDALAGLGAVAILPNYRHYPSVRMPGFMQDAARAASWAAAYARDTGDPQRLVLMGHSAGAHLAALVALDPRYYGEVGAAVPRVNGVIGLSGPYDFLPLLEDDLKDMFGPPELYPISQPINFVRRDAPPMLLIHGDADERVLPKNSRNFAAALTACGAAVTLHMYPGLGHADTIAPLSRPVRGRAPILAEIAAFVDHVSAAGTAGEASAHVG